MSGILKSILLIFIFNKKKTTTPEDVVAIFIMAFFNKDFRVFKLVNLIL
jgi:hypothetical protein